MQVLLDEINLASADTLQVRKSARFWCTPWHPHAPLCPSLTSQRIAALLEGPSARFQLPEGGGSVEPHPMFRLFGAMNPANDAGKRDLPPALRARFTELWVDDPDDPADIACIVSSCLSHIPAVAAAAGPPRSGGGGGGEADVDVVTRVVRCYVEARALAAPLTGAALRDGSGGRPHYSIRR